MSVVMLPSGRFRGFARVRDMKDAQTFDHQKDAQTWADKTMGRMRKGTWVKQDRTALEDAPKGLTIADVWPQYLKSEEWLAKADSTRRSEIPKHIPVLAELGDKLLTELTADDVRAYISKRRDVKPVRSKDPKAKLSGAQIRLEVAALSAMLAWAIETKKIIDNVTLTVKKPVSDRRTQRMSDQVIGKFFSCPAIDSDLKAYTFFMTLFSAGCRPGEISHAEKSWLRDQPPQITLPRTKNEDARTIVLPIPVHRCIRAIVDASPATCKYIFATKKRFEEGWGPYNYRDAWDTPGIEQSVYLDEVGLQGIAVEVCERRVSVQAKGEQMMTEPHQRTRALLKTRRFLETLTMPGDTPGIADDVRKTARQLLRHYPLKSSSICPVIRCIATGFPQPKQPA